MRQFHIKVDFGEKGFNAHGSIFKVIKHIWVYKSAQITITEANNV